MKSSKRFRGQRFCAARRRWVLAFASTVLFMGCENRPRADYSALDLAEVSGVVRMDGSPLSGVRVVFENEDKTFSFAETDGEGRYRMRFDSDQYGVPTGKKIVRITGRFASDGEEPNGEERIPPRYNTQSELTADVAPGQQTKDFDLESST